MIKGHEKDLLWDSVMILTDQDKLENAKVLFKELIENTLYSLQIPTRFLEDLRFTTPTKESLDHFRSLEKDINQALKDQDPIQAYEYLYDYIQEVSKIIDVDSKRIFAHILAESKNAALAEPTNAALAELVPVATPSLISIRPRRGVMLKAKNVFYSSSQVAEILGVSDQTIRRWCEKGKFPGAFQTEGGHWRIPKKHFKITLEQARKRIAFDEKLNQYNQMEGEVSEDEFL